MFQFYYVFPRLNSGAFVATVIQGGGMSRIAEEAPPRFQTVREESPENRVSAAQFQSVPEDEHGGRISTSPPIIMLGEDSSATSTSRAAPPPAASPSRPAPRVSILKNPAYCEKNLPDLTLMTSAKTRWKVKLIEWTDSVKIFDSQVKAK